MGEKRRLKCVDCRNRSLIPLPDSVIYHHHAEMLTVGLYPWLEDDTCCFAVADFDEAEWPDNARALKQACEKPGAPVALAISRPPSFGTQSAWDW